MTALPTADVIVTLTPQINKTTRTGGIRHDLVQVALSSSDSRFVNHYTLAVSGTVEPGDKYRVAIDGMIFSYTVTSDDTTLGDVAAGRSSASTVWAASSAASSPTPPPS